MAQIGKDIETAAQYLRHGELVGIPTETVYGLAGNAYDESAVLKIFDTKRRPSFDPLIVHISKIEQLQGITTDLPQPALELANKFWPGPLTLLLPKSSIISDLVTAGLKLVGVRMPNHPLTLQLLNSLSFPLAAPSANPFGYISPTSAQHVADQLGNNLPYILDGGKSEIGLESTVIGFEGEKAIIYRMGGLTLEQVQQYVAEVEVRPHSTSNPQSPGQLASHYAPSKTLHLGNIDELLFKYKDKNVGIISYRSTYAVPNQFTLSPSGDIDEAARNLFAALRQLDYADVDIILAEEVPDYGLGRAINDRLRRAAAAQPVTG